MRFFICKSQQARIRMLEKIREGSQGVIAKTILVLVILSFAFAGVSSYLGSSSEIPAATVNGEEISQSALEQAYQNERARMKQQLGDLFDSLAANDNYLQSIKRSVLDRLIAEKLVDQAARELGLRVSDEQIKKAIVAETAFQTDGVFDNERYQALIRQIGYNPASFSEMMRVDMTRNQLIAAVVGTDFVLEGEAKQYADVEGQTRNIGYKLVEAAPFLDKVAVSDEDAQAYYEQNLGQFVNPEAVSLEYIELSAAALANDIEVSEEQIRAEYEAQQSLYMTAEKRLAAHILLADEAAAKAVYDRLVAGEDFAALAKAESQDTFSGENGGQLDWFEAGVMAPEFDQALFALEKGLYSNLVKTDFGYHIIKLLDLQPAAVAPFEQVKDKVAAELKLSLAADKFYELNEQLKNVSYEVPDTLAEAAAETGTQVKSTPMMSHSSAIAPFDNPEVLKAAFSETVVSEGLNSEVIELGDNHVIVVRKKDYQPAGTKSFEDVKDSIVARLKQDKANEMAKVEADALLAKLDAGDTSVELTKVASLSRNAQNIAPSIVTKAFQLPTAELPSTGTAGLASGYAVVVLDGVNAAKAAEPAMLAAIKQRLNAQYSEADYRALVAALKSSAEVLYPVAE